MQSHGDGGAYCPLPKGVTDPAPRGTAKAPQALPQSATRKIPAGPRETVLSGESGDPGTQPERWRNLLEIFKTQLSSLL